MHMLPPVVVALLGFVSVKSDELERRAFHPSLLLVESIDFQPYNAWMCMCVYEAKGLMVLELSRENPI